MHFQFVFCHFAFASFRFCHVAGHPFVSMTMAMATVLDDCQTPNAGINLSSTCCNIRTFQNETKRTKRNKRSGKPGPHHTSPARAPALASSPIVISFRSFRFLFVSFSCFSQFIFTFARECSDGPHARHEDPPSRVSPIHAAAFFHKTKELKYLVGGQQIKYKSF